MAQRSEFRAEVTASLAEEESSYAPSDHGRSPRGSHRYFWLGSPLKPPSIPIGLTL